MLRAQQANQPVPAETAPATVAPAQTSAPVPGTAQPPSAAQIEIRPVEVSGTKAAPKAAPRRGPVEAAPAQAASSPVTAQSAPPVDANTLAAGLPAAITGSLATPPVVERYQLPQKSYSTTAQQLEETINLKDPQDAVKYMPGLLVRKRNDGDNSSVLATRTWGLNSSARTLIYQDELLLSALIGNNNNAASPRWHMVSPESISRVDFLSGPFAAAYPGNSMGGVLLISTKMPERFEATAKETVSIMPFHQYGTRDTYISSQTSASIGDKKGPFSWFLSATFQDSHQQPLTYTTNGSVPSGTVGTFLAKNKQGVVANVVGTGVLATSEQTAVNLKMALDVAPAIKATYAFGVWVNDQVSRPETYLRSATSLAPTFAGISGFASGRYEWNQTHVSNAISLKSDTKGVFDFDLSASSYNYLRDIQLNPFTVASTGTMYSANGRITRNDGTNWQNADAKFIWRPDGAQSRHEISFGVHADRYRFENPVYASASWINTTDTGTGQLYSTGLGETRTTALWAQDAWRIMPDLKLTLGARLEDWRAYDGINLNTTTSSAGVITSSKTAIQPELSSTNVSPKASLSYDLDRIWNVTGSFGKAYRYPTVTELYQNVTVAGVATFANPNLEPEEVFSNEIALERKTVDGRVRFSAFREHVNNAIISQTNLVTNPVNNAQVPTTTISNVAAIRMQGVEASAEQNNVVISGLQLFGSVTYVDSEILSDPTWAGTSPLTGLPTTVVGKQVPYIPEWRAKMGFTYRPTTDLAWTVAARHAGKMYSTLDNTDVIGHVYGAFDHYFVVDTKLHYEPGKNVSFDFGIDNLFNQQYMLFHPFPGRTFVLAGRVKF